jgi:hypothetical protein
MSKFECKIIGIPVRGYEEDYIEPLVETEDGDYMAYGACGLLGQAGAVCVETGHLYGFQYAKMEDSSCASHWEERRKKYKEESGRDYPLVYKMKIVVEAEPLSEEESKKIWDDVAEKYKD